MVRSSDLPDRPRSATLIAALSIAAIFGACLLILSLRIIREPSDLLVIAVTVWVCPIGGLLFTASRVQRDLRGGASLWQTAAGVALAAAIFLYGLAPMTHFGR